MKGSEAKGGRGKSFGTIVAILKRNQWDWKYLRFSLVVFSGDLDVQWTDLESDNLFFVILNHPPAEPPSIWFQDFPDVDPLSLSDDAVSKEAGKGSLNMMYSLSLLKSAFGFSKTFPTDLLLVKKEMLATKPLVITCFRFFGLDNPTSFRGIGWEILTNKKTCTFNKHLKIPTVCGWKRDMLCWIFVGLVHVSRC